MAGDERPAQQRGLLRGQPERPGGGRERALANLRQNAAQKHGSFVEAITRPLTEEHEARGRGEFPHAASVPGGAALIRNLARQMALADRYEAYIEASPAGPMGARGALQPAAIELHARREHRPRDRTAQGDRARARRQHGRSDA